MAIQDAYWLPFTLFRWVLAQVKYSFSAMKALVLEIHDLVY
jgi:hypothetical protein